MFKITVEKVQSNRRRVAVIETIDTRILRNSINFHITLLEKEGKQHFSKSAVKTRLIDDIGWPVNSDTSSVKLFDQLFKQEVGKYQPSLRGWNCYSFQLKPAPNHTVQTKILKR